MYLIISNTRSTNTSYNCLFLFAMKISAAGSELKSPTGILLWLNRMSCNFQTCSALGLSYYSYSILA